MRLCVLALWWLVVVGGSAPAHAQVGEGDRLAASGDRVSLEAALAAYASVPASSDDGPRALAGAAWALFLLDRPAESIAAYVALLDRIADAPSPDPRRDEALRMIAAMLADLDWDHDGAPDARPLARLTDPALVPTERPWLAALWVETAHALYLTSHDPDAIAVLHRALLRWPLPADDTPLAAACARHRARPSSLHDEPTEAHVEAERLCALHEGAPSPLEDRGPGNERDTLARPPPS